VVTPSCSHRQRLRAGHAPAVLAFELPNRVYFAASVSDRGDEFYDRFTERHSALLAEQEAASAPSTYSSPRTARSWAICAPFNRGRHGSRNQLVVSGCDHSGRLEAGVRQINRISASGSL